MYSRKQKQKEAMMEVKAHIARESMRELAVDRDKPPPATAAVPFGPAPPAKPYGTWKPVVREYVGNFIIRDVFKIKFHIFIKVNIK